MKNHPFVSLKIHLIKQYEDSSYLLAEETNENKDLIVT
jgi:hypothetical protein